MQSRICKTDSRHLGFLRDQSSLHGHADTIALPESEAEVCQIITELASQRVPVTIQGGQTGLSGGAVPLGGHILNLSRMQDIVGIEELGEAHFTLEVQAGLPLQVLVDRLQSRRLETKEWPERAKKAWSQLTAQPRVFWPVEPTEQTATVGGVAAGDSRGPTAYLYGSARRHIRAIRVVDSAGHAWRIERGQYCFIKGICRHPNGTRLHLSSLSSVAGPAPDLLDLYLGSEGVLGPITTLTLDLIVQPAERWAIIAFFQDEVYAAGFIDTLRGETRSSDQQAAIAALEFFDATTLAHIQALKGLRPKTAALPAPPSNTEAAVYLELHGGGAEGLEDLAARILTAFEQHHGDPDHCLAFIGEGELARARLFCHSAIEAVLVTSDTQSQASSARPFVTPELPTTSSTFTDLLAWYREELANIGLSAAIFGHAGELRVTLVLLPEQQGEVFGEHGPLASLVASIKDAGGQLAGDYGYGKLGSSLARRCHVPERLKILQTIKQQLDPEGLFNQGNLFERPPPPG